MNVGISKSFLKGNVKIGQKLKMQSSLKQSQRSDWEENKWLKGQLLTYGKTQGNKTLEPWEVLNYFTQIIWYLIHKLWSFKNIQVLFTPFSIFILSCPQVRLIISTVDVTSFDYIILFGVWLLNIFICFQINFYFQIESCRVHICEIHKIFRWAGNT